MDTENKSWLECLNIEEWGIDDAWLLPRTKYIYAKNLIVCSTDIRRVKVNSWGGPTTQQQLNSELADEDFLTPRHINGYHVAFIVMLKILSSLAAHLIIKVWTKYCDMFFSTRVSLLEQA